MYPQTMPKYGEFKTNVINGTTIFLPLRFIRGQSIPQTKENAEQKPKPPETIKTIDTIVSGKNRKNRANMTTI